MDLKNNFMKTIDYDHSIGFKANSTGRSKKTMLLDGISLKCSDLVLLGKGDCLIELADETWERIRKSRKVIDDVLERNETVYGINTGFGKFANVMISAVNLEELQRNLIRSHSAGVGKSLSTEHTRMLLALRINVLAKGYSGISVDTLKGVIKAFNKSCLSVVPEQGTVGASGDLAPLSHIALGLMGEGQMWSPKTGVANALYVLEQNGLIPICLKAKEGLALINGTQFIAALGAECVERSIRLALQADIISALSIESLRGNIRHFDADIHTARPHIGQNEVASRLRCLLHSDKYKSQIFTESSKHRRVQDPYTFRCIPQVHGCVIDTIKFVKNTLEIELNSATDNPMVFTERNELVSGGNFHGQYPAKVLDYLAIGVQDLANISERRIDRLMQEDNNKIGLPSFLAAREGLQSGFMIAHCTAAALASENKTLCHPSSVDSISTSGGQEDHVSMGGWSARKALKVVENVEYILAIELLAACQAFDFIHEKCQLQSNEPLEAIHSLVRTHIDAYNVDRYMAPDIEKAVQLIRNGQLWSTIESFLDTKSCLFD